MAWMVAKSLGKFIHEVMALEPAEYAVSIANAQIDAQEEDRKLALLARARL